LLVDRPKARSAPPAESCPRSAEPCEHPRQSRARLWSTARNKAIEVKLQQREKSMSHEESNSPADCQRETRAHGAPIRNVETVTEVKDESGRAGAKPQLQPYPLTPEDAERVGRELARRILAFAAAHRD
jgi:hypothetical protein